MQQYVRTHTYRGEYVREAGFKGSFFFKIDPMVDNNGPIDLNENQWLDFLIATWQLESVLRSAMWRLESVSKMFNV